MPNWSAAGSRAVTFIGTCSEPSVIDEISPPEYLRCEDWMTLEEITLGGFAACNSLRIFAYIPQIRKAARDENGASAISYTTWILFFIAHLSTVAYAIVNRSDWGLATCFAVNAACCLAGDKASASSWVTPTPASRPCWRSSTTALAHPSARSRTTSGAVAAGWGSSSSARISLCFYAARFRRGGERARTPISSRHRQSEEEEGSKREDASTRRTRPPIAAPQLPITFMSPA